MTAPRLAAWLMAVLAAGFVLAALAGVARAETCSASWYGAAHHGKRTASGERFDMHALTAAHRTWRFGTRVRVSYRGRSVVVRVNDRGPFVGGRCIDLSQAAAARLGLIGAGVASVRVEKMP